MARRKKRKSTQPRRYRDEKHRQMALARRRELLAERELEDPDSRRRRLEHARAYRATHRAELNRKRRARFQMDLEASAATANPCSSSTTAPVGSGDTGCRWRTTMQCCARQGGVCGICKRQSGMRLCVDHCHATGRVRGLLCRTCNSGLGFYQDDPRLTRAATAYLEAPPGGARRAIRGARRAPKAGRRLARAGIAGREKARALDAMHQGGGRALCKEDARRACPTSSPHRVAVRAETSIEKGPRKGTPPGPSRGGM